MTGDRAKSYGEVEKRRETSLARAVADQVRGVPSRSIVDAETGKGRAAARKIS